MHSGGYQVADISGGLNMLLIDQESDLNDILKRD
jgi:hypothetical protein